jgi:hypothetical protein
MNTENKVVGNSIFYNNNLDANSTTTDLFKKIKIRFSKKQQRDTKNIHIEKMDIGTPQIKSTTNTSLQRLIDIKINNNLSNFIDIQNSNDNNEKNMVQNNQLINTEEVAPSDTTQEPQRDKLLQDIRNFKSNKALKNTKENNKENNTNTSLQSIIEKEIEKRRQFIDSEEDEDEYNYDRKNSFA